MKQQTVRACREIGGASTWSLERLDAMAAEAKALFTERCSPFLLSCGTEGARQRAPNLKPKPRRAPPAQPASSSSAPQLTSAQGRPVDASRGGAVSRQDAGCSPPRDGQEGAGPAQARASELSGRRDPAEGAAPGVASKPARRRGSRSRAKATEEEAEDAASSGEGASEARLKEKKGARRKVVTGVLEWSGRGPQSPAAASCSTGGAGSPARARTAVCSFPMQALSAVNDVLFLRHGYHRMDRHGDPRCCCSLVTSVPCSALFMTGPSAPGHDYQI